MDLGRAVLTQGLVSTDPSWVIADHADGNPLNNTAANMHWVMSSFNKFNCAKKRGPNGYAGIAKRGRKFTPTVAGISHGSYGSAETAALAYNLVCHHLSGDQLEKTPHLLNNVPNKESQSAQVAVMPTGAVIHCIDNDFVVFFKDRIRPNCKHEKLKYAKEAADRLVSDLRVKRDCTEQDWQEKAEKMEVTDKENGIAFIATSSGAKVLVSNKFWKKVQAKGANVWLVNGQPTIWLDGRTRDMAC